MKPVGPAIRDAQAMIAAMDAVLSPECYVFASTDDETLAAEAFATVHEEEGVSLVLEAGRAAALGFALDLPMRRITLRVHSALDGVGLTAAVSHALAADGIPCNIVAAFHHDHVFVPVDCAERALAILGACQSTAKGA